MNEMTLGYKLFDGTEINLHVGVHDWDAQCALVEDQLHAYHLSTGATNADMPAPEILGAAYCIRNMRDSLHRLEAKVDQLIEENAELRRSLE